MIANTNKNMERSKLLAAVAVLALVVCAFAVALPAVDAAGEDDMAAYDLDSTETPVTVYASLADYNNGTNGSEKTLKVAIDELAANQVLVFSEGKYNVRDSDTNQPAFVIDEDNVTVIGAGIGKTIIYTDYFSTNNESAASIIITGENSDISGMTVWDAYTLRDTGITAMKSITVSAANANIHDIALEANQDSSVAEKKSNQGGVLLIQGKSGETGTITVEDVTIQNGTINLGWFVGATDSVVDIKNVTMNITGTNGGGIWIVDGSGGDNTTLPQFNATDYNINVETSDNNALAQTISNSPAGTIVNINSDANIKADTTIGKGVTVNVKEDTELTVTGGELTVEAGDDSADAGIINNGGAIVLEDNASISMENFNQISGNGSLVASASQVNITGTSTGEPVESDFGIIVISKNVYDGTEQTPNLRVVGPKNVTNVNIYEDTITPQTDVGTYSASVKVSFQYEIGNSSYTGSIQFDIQWSIYAKEITAEDIKDIPIQGITAQTPGPFEPELEIVVDGNTLVEGTDYTVTYENNDVAGIGTAIVNGIGHYTGTVEKTFHIVDYQGYVDDLEEFIGGSEGLGKEVPGAEPMTYAQIPAINDAITAAYNALYSATNPDELDGIMDDAKMDIVIATKDTVKDFLATVYNDGKGYMGKVMTEEQYNAAIASVGPEVYLPKDIVNAYENALEDRTDFDYSAYIQQLEEFIGGDQGLGKEVPGAEPMTYAQVPEINQAITDAYAGIYAAGDTDSVQKALEDGEMGIVVATKNTVKHFLATVYNNGQGYMGWMMTEAQYEDALTAIGPDGTYMPADTIRVYENALENREACYSITYMVGDDLYLYQGGALNDFKAIVGCTVVPEGMTFVAWNVAGTDVFYMPGDMIELGVDTNMWGDNRTIVLNAVYAGGSDEPQAETVTVTFTGEGIEDYMVSVIKGQSVAQPYDPIREGYTFTGWFIEGSDVAYTFTEVVNENLVLVAGWEPVSTTTDSPATQVIAYLSSYENGVMLTIQGVGDNVYVDSGSVVVTYTYAITLGTSTLYRTVVMDAESVYANGGQYLSVYIDLSGINNITNVMFSYTGDNGTTQDSNFILYATA